MISCDENDPLHFYLRAHGVSLEKFGSFEKGLSRTQAETFLDLLRASDKDVLGIEVWRNNASRFHIESLNGWYSVGTDIAEHFYSAREFLNLELLKDDDVVTIQFK